MTDLADFMSRAVPEGKSSKLRPYADDIATLKNHGYSEAQILQYLSEKKGIKVSRPTLSRFIRAYLKPVAAKSPPPIIQKETKSEAQKEQPPEGVKNPARRRGQKFDWQNKDEIKMDDVV